MELCSELLGFHGAISHVEKAELESVQVNDEGRDWAPLNGSSDTERHPTPPLNTCPWFLSGLPHDLLTSENVPTLQGCSEDNKKCFFVNQTQLGSTRLNTGEIRRPGKKTHTFSTLSIAGISAVSHVYRLLSCRSEPWVNLVINPSVSPKKKNKKNYVH